jgi:trimeric autotransporter adhesin
MSRISKDSNLDFLTVSSTSIIPRIDVTNLAPVQGAVVYDLSSNSIAVSDGTAWSQVGNGLAGTPVGPFSSLLPGEVLTWNGTEWVNAPAGSGGPPSGAAGGDLAGLYPNPTLAIIGTATGPIGNGTTVPIVTTDAKGRVTALTSTPIVFPPSTSQISGTPIGPFPGLSIGEILTWDGTAWVNSPVSPPSGAAGGDLAGTYPNPTLAVIGTAIGPIGNGTTVPVVTRDAKGRVTALTSTPISFPSTATPTGTAGGDLAGTYPNPTLAVIGTATGPIGSGTTVPVVTTDAKGRVVTLTSTPISFPPISNGTVTNSMLAGGITNSNLQNSTVTISAGSGLTGGGSVSLGGSTSLSLSSTASVTTLTITGPVANSSDAATKQYVDAAVSALNVHAPVYVATTSAADLNTPGVPVYNNGVSGVGATLTGSAVNNALTIDGYTFIGTDVTNGTRVLVKNQVNQITNGTYVFSQLQTAGLPWVLTRASDADNSPPGELKNGDFNFVESGSANASTGWVQICAGSGPGGQILIGTDNICYAQISGAGTYSAGAGLNLGGTVFSVATGGVTNAMLAGSISNSNLLNSSLSVTAGGGLTGGGLVSLGGSTTLSIPTGGVTNSMLTNSSLTVTAGGGLTGGGLVSLGGSTTLSIPAGGVTNSMLTNSSVTITAGTGLSGGGVVALGGSVTLDNTGVTNITTGAGLTGGPITTTGTISIATGGVTNAMLAGSISNSNLLNPSVTVTAGAGLTGGGLVSLGGSTTLSIPASGVTNAMIAGPVIETKGGTGQTSYTTGDTIYASATDTISKLPIGSTGQVYTVIGGIPSWQTPSAIPTGTLLDFAGTTAPTGFLLCNGASLSTTTFAALFSVTGYTYGGSGPNFNVPDFRGRFARYADTMGTAAGRDPGPRDATQAQTQSTAVNGLAMDTIGNHQHTGWTNPVQGLGGSATGTTQPYTGAGMVVQPGVQTAGAGSHTHNLTQPVGAETRPINVSCFKIIKF